MLPAKNGARTAGPTAWQSTGTDGAVCSCPGIADGESAELRAASAEPAPTQRHRHGAAIELARDLLAHGSICASGWGQGEARASAGAGVIGKGLLSLCTTTPLWAGCDAQAGDAAVALAVRLGRVSPASWGRALQQKPGTEALGLPALQPCRWLGRSGASGWRP